VQVNGHYNNQMWKVDIRHIIQQTSLQEEPTVLLLIEEDVDFFSHGIKIVQDLNQILHCGEV
jgi:hypothetical protein